MTDRAARTRAKSRRAENDPWVLTRLERCAQRALAKHDPSVDDTVPAEAPADPAMRAKWVEEIGGDPLAAADRFRAERRGEPGIYDGAQWSADAPKETLAIVRDGEGDAPGPRGIDPRDIDPVDFDPGETDPADLDLGDDWAFDDHGLPPLPADLAADALKPKWEAFARLYAYGHSAADAARHAGYAWNRAAQSGWRLLQDQRIRDRVQQLTRHLYDREAWDTPGFVTRLEAIYREAMHRGQYLAAVRAVEAAARIERHAGEEGKRPRARRPGDLPQARRNGDTPSC